MVDAVSELRAGFSSNPVIPHELTTIILTMNRHAWIFTHWICEGRDLTFLFSSFLFFFFFFLSVPPSIILILIFDIFQPIWSWLSIFSINKTLIFSAFQSFLTDLNMVFIRFDHTFHFDDGFQLFSINMMIVFNQFQSFWW